MAPVPLALRDGYEESESANNQALLLHNISKYEGKSNCKLILQLLILFCTCSFEGSERKERCIVLLHNFGGPTQSQKKTHQRYGFLTGNEI